MKVFSTTTSLVSLASAALFLASPISAQDESDCLTIPEIACTTDGFATLCDLLDLSGLDEALSANATFTVFAPLDAAFDELPDDIVESLLNDTGKWSAAKRS